MVSDCYSKAWFICVKRPSREEDIQVDVNSKVQTRLLSLNAAEVGVILLMFI